MRQENDLPNGAELANAIEELFKKGTFSETMSSLPFPVKNQPEKRPMKRELDAHMYDFCFGVCSRLSETENDYGTTRMVKNYFGEWKHSTAKRLREHTITPDDEIEALENLTLQDVAAYTNEQFNIFDAKVANTSPNSKEHAFSRGQYDFFALVDKIIQPAADPD